jgi:hypothetical protein
MVAAVLQRLSPKIDDDEGTEGSFWWTRWALWRRGCGGGRVAV